MNVPRTPTTSSHPADALLAAFVDGQLDGDEHRQLVEHLAGCEVCREVVAETAKTLRDPELAGFLDDDGDGDEDVEPSSGSSGKVLRPKKSRFRRALPLIATLTAAAAVTALLVLTPAGRGILGWQQATVAELTTDLEGEGVRTHLATGGFEARNHGWDVTLGTTLANLDDETAFQLGVRVSELDVALRLDDKAAAKLINAKLSLLASDVTIVDLFFVEVDKGLAEGEPTETLLRYNSRADELIRGDESTTLVWYELGRWAAAGQLASKSEDQPWFARSSVRRELRRLRREEWPPAIEGTLDSISGLVAAGVDSDEWAELRAAFDDLLRAGGNHDSWTEPSDSENEPAD